MVVDVLECCAKWVADKCISTLNGGTDSLRVSPRKSMDDEVVMNLFEKFTGYIKADTQVDCRKKMRIP